MALPELLIPARLPLYLQNGHQRQRTSRYAPVPMGTGHNRNRPMTLVLVDVADVGLMLEDEEIQTFEAWLESSLQVGTLHFSTRISNLTSTGIVWQEAQWVEMPRMEALSEKWWRVTGRIRLIGEPSALAPASTSASVDFGFSMDASVAVSAIAAGSIDFSLRLNSLENASIDYTLELTTAASASRITSDGDARVTSDGDRRITSVG